MSERFALIIEDEKDEAIIFSRALQTAGFEVEIVRTGDAALARLATVVPDVVVLDLHLPHVGGHDILHQIRRDDRLVQTRVIVVTGDPQMAESLYGDADLVLIKPVGFDQLSDLAARLIAVPPPGA